MSLVEFVAGLVVFVVVVSVAGRLTRRRSVPRPWTAEAFGRPIERERDMARIAAYHRLRRDRGDAPGLDERTWGDLDLDAVFAMLDRTVSQTGAQYLYHMLRTPHADVAPLRHFDDAATALEADPALRERLGRELERLSEWHKSYLPDLFYGELPPPPSIPWLYPLLAAAGAACLMGTLVHPRFFLVAMGVMIANLVVRQLFSRRIDPLVPGLRALPAYVATARGVAAIESPALERYLAPLRERVPLLRGLRRASAWLTAETWQMNELAQALHGYVNMFFLLDVNAYVFSYRRIVELRGALTTAFETLGALDAALSVASFRAGLPHWARPTFVARARSFAAQGVFHPLLERPVPNDVDIDGGCVLVTGSNMSGKSTFIRTIGVNALLAQTIYTACARSYRAPFLTTRASIGRNDSLQDGKSYYLAEVESVRSLLRGARGERQHLFLIDEIFRGTNTTERIAAGKAILDYLGAGDDIVFVATHDLELLELVSGYTPHHFREHIANGTLAFDYTLKPGPSSTRNAIALLELMEYPEEVVRDALRTVEVVERR